MMAGDWIKMRGNLWDDPRIAKLCDLTDCNEAQIIGGLYWLWATADQHTENGIMPGLTLRQIDRKTGIQGLGQALCDIGWLADHPEGVRLVKFEEHNGASAKKRAVTAKRVATHRTGNDDVTPPALQNEQSSVTGALAREREREDKKQKGAQPAAALPDWLPAASWAGYLEMRKKKRKEPTARAIELLLAELAKLKAAGHNIAAILDKSTVNGWTDVYPPKPGETVVPIASSAGYVDPRWKGAK